MVQFKDRLALLMQQQGRTRQEISETMDVSLISVHKWLTGGNIKEAVAQQLAAKLMCDWLWLKHGISRVTDEMVPDTDQILSKAMMIKARPDEWFVEQMGGELRQLFKRDDDDQIIDLETSNLSLPQYWESWGIWGQQSLNTFDNGELPLFDCSGVLVDRHEQTIADNFKARLANFWTDSEGETHLMIVRETADLSPNESAIEPQMITHPTAMLA